MPSEERIRNADTGKGDPRNDEIVDAIREIMKRCEQISARNGKTDTARRK